MSTLPENNELDLEKLFLPAWAQEPASAKHYASYEGGEDRGERRDRRGPRPPRRDGGGGAPRGNRPPGAGGERRGPRPEGQGRGPRPGGDRGRSFGKGPRDFQRSEPREQRRETPPPLPDVNVSLTPDGKGVESLARQIKMTGRAYPLFDIARLVLQKPERYSVAFSVKKNAEGKVIQPLFLCALDDTLWLSEAEAVDYILKKHFGTFYQAERTATEPPKGKYTFVAQCGMSGVILGPPNHHDYQNQLRKLHTERFSRLPFEDFKARVKIVRDEEVVKKWIEEQSFKTEYVCLNVPEAPRLANLEAVEKHFRETHKENIIKPVEAHTLSGVAAKNLRGGLSFLVRQAWEDQKRFPLQLATTLSQQFAGHGLQFFKVNKSVTHVSVARPHFLDLGTTPVSEGVKRIVEFINANPKTTRRKLFEALAPTPKAAAPAPAAPAEGAPAAQAAPQAAPAAEPTPEQTAINADLHWLIHQGHVIEFADGRMETAKKPAPKPPKPEKKPAAAAAAAPEVATTETPAVTEEPAISGEPEKLDAESVSIAEDIAAAKPAEQPGEIPATRTEPAAE